MNDSDKFISNISGIFTIITSIIVIIGYIKSSLLVFFIGVVLTLSAVVIFIKIKSYPKYTEIEGLRIDAADNIPLFVTKKNKLNPIKVCHTCHIMDESVILEYECYGLCIDKKGMDCFSMGMYANDVFNEKDWYAYDIKNDPDKRQKLNPKVVTPKGATKKAVFTFNKKIKYNEYCGYYSYQKINNVISKTGKDYYLSSLLYKNRPIHDYKVVLKFYDVNPQSIKVYSIKNRRGEYLYSLTNANLVVENGIYTYTDVISGESAWSLRVYVFERN